MAIFTVIDRIKLLVLQSERTTEKSSTVIIYRLKSLVKSDKKIRHTIGAELTLRQNRNFPRRRKYRIYSGTYFSAIFQILDHLDIGMI